MIESKVDHLYPGLLLLNQKLKFHKYLLYMSAPVSSLTSFLNGGLISAKKNPNKTFFSIFLEKHIVLMVMFTNNVL